MSYSEALDSRIISALSVRGATRKKIFGGICHLIHGNMMCGVYKDSLVLRLGEEQASKTLKETHVRPFDVTGKPMKGWVMVKPVNFFMRTALMMLMISGCSAVRSEDAAGTCSTHLLNCPESPNCVSTEAPDNRHKIDAFRLKGDFSKNWSEIQRVLAALPRCAVVKADETYLHATFKSRVFGFVDDLEFFLNPSNGIISIRSAAQTGYWDFGVNRRRVEHLRQELRARELIHHP